MSITAMVLPTGLLGVTMFFESALRLGPWVWVAHSGLIGAAMLVVWWFYARDKREVKRLIAQHAYLLCPRCRYPLDALPPTAATDRCPECGTANDPVRTREVWRAWEASLERPKRK
jgi:hypothetical protein